MNIDIFYHKIKLLLLEYENTQKLDKDYMEIFLKEFNNNLNLKMKILLMKIKNNYLIN